MYKCFIEKVIIFEIERKSVVLEKGKNLQALIFVNQATKLLQFLSDRIEVHYLFLVNFPTKVVF